MLSIVERRKLAGTQTSTKEILSKQLNRLRDMQAAHANEDRGIQRAVVEIDRITERVVSLVRATWPEHPAVAVATAERSTDDTTEHAVV